MENFILAINTMCSEDDSSKVLFEIIGSIVTFLKIGVPIILIVMGTIDLGKAVMAADQDKIKAGQRVFFSRLIAALIVFFIIPIVSFVLKLLPGDVISTDVQTCIDIIF